MKLLFVFIFSLLATSCSTIFCGSRKSIVIDSNISTNEVIDIAIDGELHRNIQFPYSVKVKRSFRPSFIKGVSEGYYPATIDINKEFNTVSVINLLFIPGWLIDLASGVIATTEQDYYYLQFDKK